MRQGINISYVRFRRNSDERRPLQEAISLCRDAGFVEYDYLSAWDCDDYSEVAKRERELFDANGCYVHQTHCPFFRYKLNGIEEFRRAAPRAVEISGILGAKYMVLHGDEWPEKGVDYDCSLAAAKNYEVLAPVVEMCARHGVTPAFENLFDEKSRKDDNGRDRFSAKAEDLLDLLERFGKGNVGICLDTGHAYVSYKDEVLKLVASLAPYVVCTHVHDNKSSADLHQPAFAGTLPLEEVFTILKKNGYAGNLTWEMVYGRYPDELLPDFLKLLHKSGEYLDAL